MKKGTPALLLMVLSAAFLFSPNAAARSKPAAARGRVINGNSAMQPALECSKCHSDIFRNWKQSMHAAAFENPVFQTAYRKAWLVEGPEAARSCLPCHAPNANVTGDHGAALAITREGVTCISCHGTAAAGMRTAHDDRSDDPPGGMKHPTPAALKTGTHTNSGHGGNFSGIRPCAGCHDSENRHKMHISATQTEWSASPSAAAGETCQKCHMPSVRGRTANKDGREGMHDHSLAATLETIREAVTAEITDVTVNSGAVTASITLRNAKAGHSVPTGSPARSLVLEVRLMNAAGTVLEAQKRIYRKALADADGNGLSSYSDAFLHAATVASDNRLAPGETRVETVSFKSFPGENAKVTVELYLLANPYVAQRIEMKIPLSIAGGIK